MTDHTPAASSGQVFDLIVLGAGPVGENLADRAVQGGLTALIVESELVGGECSYWACMPSKAILRPGAALRAARSVQGTGAVPAHPEPDAVLARRTSFTSGWDDAGQVSWLESAGIALVRGRGRLVGERTVAIDHEDGTTTSHEARVAVALCTGSEAVIPDIPGLAEASPWTNREALAATAVPDSLIIVGAGVVGTELASAFIDLGSEVTLIRRGGVLGGFEPFAGEAVEASLIARGVRVIEGEAIRVNRDGSGPVTVELAPGQGAEAGADEGEILRAAELLVATGRRPRVRELGLDTLGLSGEEPLDVDDRLRVRGPGGAVLPWLYAAGDVAGRAPLTHQGKYEARIAGDAIAAADAGEPIDAADWGRHVATADTAAVPQTVFTDPEVAAVGPTLAEAEKQGLPVRAVDVSFDAVAGASLHADGYAGQARFLVDTERRVLLGATFLGPDVSELLHAATIAVVGEVPLDRLWHAVPAYPTMSEIWLRFLEAERSA